VSVTTVVLQRPATISPLQSLGGNSTQEAPRSSHLVCVVARQAKALGWVDGEGVSNLDDALDRLDDEDDSDEAGETLLGESCNVADKSATMA
jgi:hypothetical protein